MSARFNPLAELDPFARDYAEQLDVIADAQVIQSGAESRFWTESARTVIAGYIDYLVRRPDPVTDQYEGMPARTLGELRDLLTDRYGPPLGEMGELGGKARGAAAVLDHAGEAVSANIVATCIAHTRSLDSPAMREMLSASDFSLRELNRGDTTIYLLLQSQHRTVHEPIIRLLKSQAAAAAGGGKCKHPTLVICDETYVIGPFGTMPKSTGMLGGSRLLRKFRGSVLCLNADAGTVRATASYRRALGQTVHILDPMNVLEGGEG